MWWSIYRQQVKYDNGSEAEDRAENPNGPKKHPGKEAEALSVRSSISIGCLIGHGVPSGFIGYIQ
jgi:hypothetical protein